MTLNATYSQTEACPGSDSAKGYFRILKSYEIPIFTLITGAISMSARMKRECDRGDLFLTTKGYRCYLGHPFIVDGLVDVKKVAGEAVDLDGALQSFSQKFVIVGYPVHEDIKRRLQIQTAFKFLAWKG